MEFFLKLFRQERQPVNFKEIIFWWGERRLAFNIIVGVSGIMSLIICWIAGWPMDVIYVCIIAFSYGIAANIIYTSGWIAEGLLRRANNYRLDIMYIGPIFFAMGLAVSILLTFFGGLLAGYEGCFQAISFTD
ncbi:MAG: hypothetical protein ACHQFW_02000 [Chitinophagales bacterium]